MMTDSRPHSLTPRELVHAFSKRRGLWMVPTLVGIALGVVFALMTSPEWEASQGLIVRQEAAGSQHQRPGSFSTTDEMKRIQETILEIAKSPSVLARTLGNVGAPEGASSTVPFPTQEDVEEFRKDIRMTPPGGAEFGMTEVLYLAVRASSTERALSLLAELGQQLESRFMEVRNDRAQSMVTELEKTVALAAEDLEEATAQLAKFESAVGADLTELRMLLNSPSGTSDLRQKLVSIENTRQEFAAQLQQQDQLLKMLNAAQQDPLALVATPNSLLDAQPGLRRLKEGLVEAQLTTSRLLGRRSPRHPEVIAAQHSEQEVRESLRRELKTAIRGVEVDLQISADRIAAVEKDLARGKHQLERLASLRASYANLVALTDDRTRLLEQARKNLAEAHASQASARAASLIGRIDTPYVGVHPVGPGRAVIAAAGAAGGLAAGIALVFLFGLPAQTTAATVQSQAAGLVPRLPAAELPIRETAAAPLNSAVFGMFRGKSLRQAIEEVRLRDTVDGTGA